MKKRNMFLILVASVTALAFTNYSQIGDSTKSRHHLVTNKRVSTDLLAKEKVDADAPPVNHDFNVSSEDFLKARKQARAMKAAYKAKVMKTMSIHIDDNTTPQWQMRGPYTYGRVTAIVADPENTDKVYVGTPQGGVWKSTDGGEHYTPIFDDAGALSIGSLALDPNDSDTIYVGTGEIDYTVLKTDTYGDGIWKSTDGGQTWEHLGLENEHRIGSIVINPNNTQEIFATSYNINDTKGGVFRSRDGGHTWKNISKDIEGIKRVRVIHMDPSNSSRLYISTWNSPNASIWKSEDGGDTWVKLTNGLPSSAATIRFAIAPSSPSRVYITYTNSGNREIYLSDDYGQTWQKRDANLNNNGKIKAGRPVYYGNIVVSPTNKDTFYILDSAMYKSTNGGNNFTGILDGHSDHHILWISPNAEIVYSGNDGGVYLSKESGNSRTYTHQNLPIGQFYAIEVDPIEHNKIFGGMQDNGTGYTTDGSDWHKIGGGDGMIVLVDNTDTRYKYTSSQKGHIYFQSITYNRYLSIPDSSFYTKMFFDSFNNKIVYYVGGRHFYKTTRTANNLSKLTLASSKSFNAINSVDVPKVGSGRTIYVADNRGIWLSRDRASTWAETSFGNASHVTRITTDPKKDSIAYATQNSYSKNIIYRLENYGETKTNISSNLPQAGANDILIDPDYSSTLYLGTDFGVYISLNGGASWEPLGLGLPETKVSDLKIIKEGSEIILYAGTYGRGIYSIRLNDMQRGAEDRTVTLDTPSNLQVTNIEKTVATLTWEHNSSNLSGFKVYINGILQTTVDANVKSYEATGLTADTFYSFAIVAYNNEEKSLPAISTFTTLSPFTKAHITSPADNDTITSRTLSIYWDINEAKKVELNVTAYSSNTTLFSGVVTGTSKTITLPTTQKEEIQIRLRSYVEEDDTKVYEDKIIIVSKYDPTSSKPTAPSELNASSIQKHSATLRWSDNSDNETGFKIYQDGNNTAIATLEANATSYTLTGLRANTAYSYTLKAYNDAGESEVAVTTFKTLDDIGKTLITYPTSKLKIKAGTDLKVELKNRGAKQQYLIVHYIVHGKYHNIFRGRVKGETQKIHILKDTQGKIVNFIIYSSAGRRWLKDKVSVKVEGGH